MAFSETISNYLENRLLPYAIRESLLPADVFRQLVADGYSISRSKFYADWADWFSRVGSRISLAEQQETMPIPHLYHELASRSQVFNYVYVYQWSVYDMTTESYVARTASVTSALRLSPDQGLAALMASLQSLGREYTNDYWQNVVDISLIRASRAQGLRSTSSDTRTITEILSGTGLQERGLF